MKQISIKLPLILLISVLVVGFSSANNKKVVQKKKSESYFNITKIIDHGFRLLDRGEQRLLNPDHLLDSLCPYYILEFEMLNNSNLTITKPIFTGHIFVENTDGYNFVVDTNEPIYRGTDPNTEKSIYTIINDNKAQEPEYVKDDNWMPKTKRTIKIIMQYYLIVIGSTKDHNEIFKHTPKTATLKIKFDGENINKDFSNYSIEKFNIIEDWRDYQRVLGLRQ